MLATLPSRKFCVAVAIGTVLIIMGTQLWTNVRSIQELHNPTSIVAPVVENNSVAAVVVDPTAIAAPVLENNAVAAVAVASLNDDPESKKMAGHDQHQCNERIILLAGPHKTGSTSRQIIANTYSEVLKDSWNWIDPPEMKNLTTYVRIKRMAILPLKLSGKRYPMFRLTRPIDTSELLNIFRKEIRKQLGLGLNILLGSEEIDSIDSDQLDTLLTIFPAEASKNIVVVINYRSPRIRHLMSLWKQMRIPVTFYHFINNHAGALERGFHAIDSMSLADAFLKRGFQVSLVDQSGMSSHGYEMFSTLGCDLMKVPCDETKMPLAIKDKPEILSKMRKHRNVKVDGVMNVTELQLEKMDNILKNYDCMFQGLLHNKNLTVLYNNQFGRNMRSCGVNISMSTSEVFASLKAIIYA
jgi:hypothetical protein